MIPNNLYNSIMLDGVFFRLFMASILQRSTNISFSKRVCPKKIYWMASKIHCSSFNFSSAHFIVLMTLLVCFFRLYYNELKYQALSIWNTFHKKNNDHDFLKDFGCWTDPKWKMSRGKSFAKCRIFLSAFGDIHCVWNVLGFWKL